MKSRGKKSGRLIDEPSARHCFAAACFGAALSYCLFYSGIVSEPASVPVWACACACAGAGLAVIAFAAVMTGKYRNLVLAIAVSIGTGAQYLILKNMIGDNAVSLSYLDQVLTVLIWFLVGMGCVVGLFTASGYVGDCVSQRRQARNAARG